MSKITPLNKLGQSRPMTQDESKIFFACTMNEKEKFPIPESELPFGFKVGKSRAETVGIKTNDWVIMAFTSWCSGPGEIVLYCQAISQNMSEKGLKEFTMTDLAYLFPNGPVTEEAYYKAWDAQKVDGVSLVDTADPEVWPTLRAKMEAQNA